MRRKGLCVASIAAAALALPPTSPAAEVIGQVGSPAIGCANDFAYVQDILSSGPAYSPSSPGIITAWSTMAGGGSGHTLKLIVFRRESPISNNWTVLQKDELRTTTTAAALNTFTGMSIPIAPGETIGLYAPAVQPSSAPCWFFGSGTDTVRRSSTAGEPAQGATVSQNVGTGPRRVNISAVVEPDADGDGFGDETQDCNPADASKTTDCAPPDTTITKGPKDRTRKKRATFEFSGTDARAVATFECSLDGGAFTACASPFTVKVKKGRHTFSVRAIDEAGNADPTPATDGWKVKPKKKR